MVLWMFSTSVLLGTFVTGMTPLAYEWDHYTISWTRVCAAWYMASWMGLVEVAMSARMSRRWMRAHTRLTIALALSCGASLGFLRSQAFVTSAAWATRMVEHHSTAITTSARLAVQCGDADDALCELAREIVSTQLREIATLRDAAPVTAVSVWTAIATTALVGPWAVWSWWRM